MQILLFDSERCWAQSQLLKSQLEDPTAPPSTKHHLAKRLNRASSHALALVELSSSPSLSSKLGAAQLGEIRAYYYSLSGSLAFERGRHAEGLETLSLAYEILRELASHAKSATSEALVNESMDEIEPMLRFCAYRSGQDTSRGVNVIAQEAAREKLDIAVPGWSEIKARLADEGSRDKKEQIEIRWRGEIVPVRNVELVDPAVKVQRVLKSLEVDNSGSKKAGEGSAGKRKLADKAEVLGARRMGTYDKALLVLGEAEQVASQLVEDNRVDPLAGLYFGSRARDLTSFCSPKDRSLERTVGSTRSVFPPPAPFPFLRSLQPLVGSSQERPPPHHGRGHEARRSRGQGSRNGGSLRCAHRDSRPESRQGQDQEVEDQDLPRGRQGVRHGPAESRDHEGHGSCGAG